VSAIEELLVRTLNDDRRALPVAAGTAQAAVRESRRLQLQRRLVIGATALLSVAVIAGGTMLADGGSAQDGKAPSYDASVSAQPRTS
jgi:hypothetical protein